MAKVLLVDTNFSSMPIYDALSAYGHEVHVVGGNPSDCLAKADKKYWPFNYANTELLSELIDREKYDFIVPGCTDRSYASCVEVNRGRFFGLDSHATEQALNNKAKFRELAKKLGISVPEIQNETSDNLRWPLIVKPVDSFSGKGITVLREPDKDKFIEAIQTAKKLSPTGNYLIEDFVDGVLHSHSAFLSQRRIVKDFIVEERCTVNPFVVDTSRVIHNPNPKVLSGLRCAIEAMAIELGLNDGLVHVQYIQNNDDFWLIEVTRRCPGDLYSRLIEMSTGYSYADAYVRPYLGLSPDSSTKRSFENYIMRHTVTVPEEKVYGDISYNYPIWVNSWVSLSLVGDLLKPSPLSRIGILFAIEESAQKLNELFQVTISRELYKVNY